MAETSQKGNRRITKRCKRVNEEKPFSASRESKRGINEKTLNGSSQKNHDVVIKGEDTISESRRKRGFGEEK
jgi:hypothetical protein